MAIFNLHIVLFLAIWSIYRLNLYNYITHLKFIEYKLTEMLMNHHVSSLLTTTVFLSLASLNTASAGSVPARNFKLPEIYSQKLVELRDYKNKIIYLDFWASWCKPCRKSLPELNKLREDLKNRSILK